MRTRSGSREGRCVGLCDGFRESESIALGLGADLAGAVAEVVGSLGFWLRSSNWVGDGLGDGLGGALELGADLTRAIAELVGRFCDCCRYWCCGRLGGGNGHEGGEDERSDLHVDDV